MRWQERWPERQQWSPRTWMNWRRVLSAELPETATHNWCLKSMIASGPTKNSRYPAVHLSQRQSSSREYAACSWPQPASRPASRTADEKIATGLHRRGVSLEQITRAILLGCARKYVSMLNAGSRTPITSLEYFADVVDEVRESGTPESYWEPLRAKVTRMEQQWLQAHAAKP